MATRTPGTRLADVGLFGCLILMLVGHGVDPLCMVETLIVVVLLAFMLLWNAAKVPPKQERRARKAARGAAWDVLGWFSNHSN
jgi:hypothetical protein